MTADIDPNCFLMNAFPMFLTYIEQWATTH